MSILISDPLTVPTSAMLSEPSRMRSSPSGVRSAAIAADFSPIRPSASQSFRTLSAWYALLASVNLTTTTL